MVNVPREPNEFEQHLAVQHGFLETSAQAFDAGQQNEAIRLAATLRVLMHDTRQSVSLLTQLGQKDHLQILDTVGDESPADDPGPWIPLIVDAGDGDNEIYAGGDNDTITTGGGIDLIFLGSGDDTAQAGGGDDEINGSSGTDTADAGVGTDSCYGIENPTGCD